MSRNPQRVKIRFQNHPGYHHSDSSGSRFSFAAFSEAHASLELPSKMFNLVLVAPEIPHNAGAAGRLCLATGSTLHLVKPLGFSLDDKQVRRAGLDYWKDVKVKVWSSLEELLEEAAPEQVWFLTTKGATAHWDINFNRGDYLVCGCETRGLPESLLSDFPNRLVRIPMAQDGTRSLNLATAAAVALYEGIRQVQ